MFDYLSLILLLIVLGFVSYKPIRSWIKKEGGDIWYQELSYCGFSWEVRGAKPIYNRPEPNTSAYADYERVNIHGVLYRFLNCVTADHLLKQHELTTNSVVSWTRITILRRRYRTSKAYGFVIKMYPDHYTVKRLFENGRTEKSRDNKTFRSFAEMIDFLKSQIKAHPELSEDKRIMEFKVVIKK